MGNAEAKCPACLGPDGEGIRKLMGCDLPHTFGEPTLKEHQKAVPTIIGCTACSGTRADCNVCDGTGEEPIFRCAGAFRDPEISAFLGALSDYENGVLPDPGGMSAQTAPFVELLRVATAERSAVMAERLKDMERSK